LNVALSTTTSFQVGVVADKTVYYIHIRYLIIDPLFPGSIDIMSNVNIFVGNLSSTKTLATTATSTKSFNLSSQIKAAFFLTCFVVYNFTGSPKLNITGQMIAPTTLNISGIIGTSINIKYLNGCFIIYDQTQI
jgi:hypothetical protein